MHRIGRVAAAVICILGTVVAGATTAQAAAFPVNPGPIVDGRKIIGTGQNLPPIEGTTYDAGPFPGPQIKAYYTGKAIDQDRADVTKAAWQWVKSWTTQNCGTTSSDVRKCKAAVVFDVDETLLDAYSYYASTDPKFTWNLDSWDAYVANCGYAGVPQTRDLYNKVKKLGLRIVIISGAARDTKSDMVPCLEANGISGWNRYILKGQDASTETAAVWKAQQRARVQDDGYKIIASIGDQVSDMSNGHLMRGFLLPNTMYYLA